VLLKAATTLDGRIATSSAIRSGSPAPPSAFGRAAARLHDAWRGIGTVLRDDRCCCRSPDSPAVLRIVFDSSCACPDFPAGAFGAGRRGLGAGLAE